MMKGWRPTVVFVAVTALTAAMVTVGTAPAPAATRAGLEEGAYRSVGCRPVHRAFAPRAVTIPHGAGRTRVLRLGTDARGVPRTPPHTDSGRWQLGWDGRVRPGSRRGVVRLTAHTYPRDGSYGSALGNTLLARLRKGDRLVAWGPRHQRLCYRVVARDRIAATSSFAAYYSSTGRPTLAILACSGKRRGPGDWSHRTVWYAVPIVRTRVADEAG